MAYTKYSLTPANNNAAPPDGAPEGMLPSAVNDTMRDMMAQIRDCGDGIRDGTYTMTTPKITGGTITGAAFTGNTFTSPVISGGTINNATIGATTATTGKFTTLEATGATTFSGATVVSASLTANTFSSSGATITGGSINNATIGASTPSTGAFTTSSLKGLTSGTITLDATAVAGTNTATFPAATGTVMVSGNMPAFSAYQSSAQTLSSNTATKLTFTTEEFDTNNNFASSTFTPTVAGYYLVTAGMEVSSSATGMLLYVYKNGSNYKKLTNSNPASISGVNGSAVVYCNGTTDYIEIYGLVATGQALVASSVSTYFQAAMVRAA